jgi:hypothetical protein
MPIPPERNRPTAGEIEVSQEMAEAGARILYNFSPRDDDAEITAAEIYRTMWRLSEG